MSVDHRGRYGPHATDVTYVAHPFAEHSVVASTAERIDAADLALRTNTERLFSRG